MEQITWLAHYTDGTTFPQYREDGRENRFAEIDRGRLFAFTLMRDGLPIFTVHLDQGAQLVFRRRCFLKPPIPEPVVFYLIGWQKVIAGRPVQAVAAIAEETGEVNMIGDWRPDHIVYGPIEPIECEGLFEEVA